MRSTMLASSLSALGLFSFVVSACAQDTASVLTPVVSIHDPARLAFDPEGSSRPVKAAANFQLISSEGVSPSDQIKKSVEPVPSQRADAVPGMISPSFQVPYAFGPSHGMSSMLRLMNCDPHSCPNIWQGYETQRAAELAQKCAPPCSRCASGCSCGGGCKGTCPLMPPSDCGEIARPINRYRPKLIKEPNGCDACDATQPSLLKGSNGCDACNSSQPAAAPCTSCQASANLPMVPVALQGQPTAQ
jgi:hypothetical protein